MLALAPSLTLLLCLVFMSHIPVGLLLPQHHHHNTGHALQSHTVPGDLTSSHHEAPMAGTYHVFHNILLNSDSSLSFFTPLNGETDQHPPAEIRLRPGDAPFAIHQQPLQEPHPCIQYVEKPHMVIDAAPWRRNIFHFYNDLAMPLFNTMVEQGWITGHEWDVRDEPLDYPEAAAVGIIGLTENVFMHNWAHLMPYLSTDRRSIQSAGGLCFRTLAVDGSQRLNWYRLPIVNITATREALHLFRHWHQQVTEDFERRRGKWPLQDFSPSFSATGTPLPRVTIAHRSLSRSILNEEDIIDLINSLYEVEIVSTEFNMSAWEAQQLISHTDVFLGMHGAGLTNAMWGKAGAALIQLMPYGWLKPNGQPLRGHGFGNMAEAAHMHYLTWMNQRLENTLLREMDMAPQAPDVPWPYQEHISPDWPTPSEEPVARMWVYQHTRVDIPSFQPVLEQAFHLAGIPKRSQMGLQS